MTHDWTMEISTRDGWATVKPTGGTAYVFATLEEAQQTMRASYPDLVRADRLDGATKRTRVRNTVTGETRPSWGG